MSFRVTMLSASASRPATARISLPFTAPAALRMAAKASGHVACCSPCTQTDKENKEASKKR
jgi:hypothetical protein